MSASPGSQISSDPLEPPSGFAVTSRISRLLRDINILALLTVIAASAALLLSPAGDASLLGLPKLAVGQPAPRTIKSPRDFAIADPETTERLRDEAAVLVRPTYDLISGLGADAKHRIEAAFSVVPRLPHPEAGAEVGRARTERPAQFEPAHAKEFMRALQVYFEESDLELLGRAGFSDELRDAVVMVVKAIYEQRIVEDKELFKLQAPQGLQLRMLSPEGDASREETVLDLSSILGVDHARAKIDEIAAHDLHHLSPEARRAVCLLAKRLLQPNVRANTDELEHRIEQARAAVKTVVIPIKLGETVLREGEPVTPRHLLLVRGMAEELESQSRFQGPAGGALLIVLLMIALYRYHRRATRTFLPQHRDLAFGASIYVVSLLVLWGGYKAALWAAGSFSFLGPHSSIWYAVPVAWGALLVRFVCGKEVAAAFVSVTALSAGFIMDHNLGYAAYVLVGSVAAATPAPLGRPRLSLWLGGLWCGCAQMLAVLALDLLASRFVASEAVVEMAMAFGSGLLSAGLAAFAIPAVEVLFGYTTAIKLMELVNLNHPLLRDLLVQAPGTYHHSILVGRLAEAGARAIGADPLLARAGGYYHDVGKIKNPRLFEENHRGQRAPAALINAKEVSWHVDEGLELGAQHRLGQPILEIIAQHHGTARIEVIERRVAVLAPLEPEPVLPNYPGPKPLTREAALVLLADVVEALTSGLLADPAFADLDRLDALVLRGIGEVVGEGQLAHSPLSLADVHAIELEFLRVLREILVRRGQPFVSSQQPGRVARPTRYERPN